MDYQAFKNEWYGRRVDYDHSYGYQCVDLICEFMKECAHVAQGIYGNAIDYANKPTQAFLNATNKVTDGSKHPGDILVFSSKTPYGHIALRDGQLDKMLEQNGKTGGGTGQGQDAIGVFRNIPYNRLVAVYRLKAFVSANPAPVAAPVHNTPAAVVNPSSPPNYDGNTITIQPGWGLSQAAEHAGWPDYGQPARWQAIATLNGSNDWITFNSSLKTGERIAVGKFEAAAPVAPTPVTHSNIIYSKWEGPVDFVTNRNPTHKWHLDFVNDVHAVSAVDLPQGTSVKVYGKAQRTDGDKPVYLMTQEDFGNANETGTPNNNSGINIVDLSPATPPQPPVNVAAQVATPNPVVSPHVTDGEAIPVTVKHWQDEINTDGYPLKDETTDHVLVKDLEGNLPDVQLVKGQPVTIAGDAVVNGIKYGFTAKSLEHKTYYGIDLSKLKTLQAVSGDAIFAGLIKEAEIIVAKATDNNLVSRLFHKK